MSQAFSTTDQNTYADFEEDSDGCIVVTFESTGMTFSVTVDPDDLARALIMASPSFATAVGDIAKQAILLFVGRTMEDENVDDD